MYFRWYSNLEFAAISPRVKWLRYGLIVVCHIFYNINYNLKNTPDSFFMGRGEIA